MISKSRKYEFNIWETAYNVAYASGTARIGDYVIAYGANKKGLGADLEIVISLSNHKKLLLTFNAGLEAFRVYEERNTPQEMILAMRGDSGFQKMSSCPWEEEMMMMEMWGVTYYVIITDADIIEIVSSREPEIKLMHNYFASMRSFFSRQKERYFPRSRKVKEIK
jgi:hypothetical protein